MKKKRTLEEMWKFKKHRKQAVQAAVREIERWAKQDQKTPEQMRKHLMAKLQRELHGK